MQVHYEQESQVFQFLPVLSLQEMIIFRYYTRPLLEKSNALGKAVITIIM